MSQKHVVEESIRPELTLQQEIGLLGEDDLFEMANLTTDQTGIEGVVFISTAIPQHAPRVKYFQKTGKGQPSFSVTVSSQPKVVATSLPERVVRKMTPKVTEWVRLNRDALLAFWKDGETWTDREVTTFKAALKKVP